MKVKIDEKKDYLSTADSLYDHVYKCTGCKYERVLSESKFCANCGSEIEWTVNPDLPPPPPPENPNGRE